MSAARRTSSRTKNQHEDTAPSEYPQVTPRDVPQNHDFTIQCVIEMQRTLGELVAKVDMVNERTLSISKKVEDIQARINYVIGGAVVAVVLVGVIWWLVADRVKPILVPPTFEQTQQR